VQGEFRKMFSGGLIRKNKISEKGEKCRCVVPNGGERRGNCFDRRRRGENAFRFADPM